MIPKSNYTNNRVWITWRDPDSDWHSFIVLWHDDTHLLLRGMKQKTTLGGYAEHDGIPFLVKWNELSSIRRRL